MSNEEDKAKKKRNREWRSENLPSIFDDGFFAEPRSSTISDFFGAGNSMPRVDVINNKDSISIKADMPDVDKRDIKLKVTANKVSISAQKKSGFESKGKNYYYQERSASGYYREILLPEAVKGETARAKYEGGTLTIDVKKARPSRSGMEVKID
jgi:HSP20 family protein